MKDIEISVIVPVYNAERYIKECLDSICHQTFKNFELILIDDGSTDESGRICDEYAALDSRIIVIHKQNEGVSIARNVGLDKVQGEWIVFIDSDDYLLPDALSILYQNVTLASADCLLAGSKLLENNHIRDYIKPIPRCSDNVLKNIFHNALWAYIFKSSIIQENNIRFAPNLAYSEDQVFLCKFALKAKTIIHIATPLYVYRKNETSACASKNGVRKAVHQFEAAHQIIQCMHKYSCSKEQQQLLKRRVKKILNLGFYSYASCSFSVNTYQNYEQAYLKYFSGKRMLFCRTLLAYALYLRRKIITFRH